jgi:hypothetical protein
MAIEDNARANSVMPYVVTGSTVEEFECKLSNLLKKLPDERHLMDIKPYSMGSIHCALVLTA